MGFGESGDCMGFGVEKSVEHGIRCLHTASGKRLELRPAVPLRPAGPWPVSAHIGYRSVEQDQEVVAAQSQGLDERGRHALGRRALLCLQHRDVSGADARGRGEVALTHAPASTAGGEDGAESGRRVVAAAVVDHQARFMGPAERGRFMGLLSMVCRGRGAHQGLVPAADSAGFCRRRRRARRVEKTERGGTTENRGQKRGVMGSDLLKKVNGQARALFRA